MMRNYVKHMRKKKNLQINREILDEISNKLKRSKRAVYYRIQKYAKEHNIVKPNMAAYALAKDLGVDVSKYLDANELDELQSIYGNKPIISIQNHGKQTDKQNSIKPIKPLRRIGQTKIFDDAYEMAEIYQYIYVFENILRYIIKNELSSKYGDVWWDKCVSSAIKYNVKGRKQGEDKDRWHIKRGADNIYYTDLDDLGKIIDKNWDDFKAIFPKQHWIKARIEEITKSRNIVAHSNKLSDKEKARIRMYYDDLIKQITNY